MEFLSMTETGILISIIFTIFYAASWKKWQFLFRYTPPVVYVYVIPMAFSYSGLLPVASIAYDTIQNYLLPAAIIFLLSSSHPSALKKMGLYPFLGMFLGTLAVLAGGLVSFYLFSAFLEKDVWKGFAALSASWIGGSSSMLAAGKSFQTPSGLMGMMVLVDTFVGYSWMAFLIFLRPFSGTIDQWNSARPMDISMDDTPVTPTPESRTSIFSHTHSLAFAILIMTLGSELLLRLGKVHPGQGKIISAFGWTVLYATLAGFLVSFLSHFEKNREDYQNLGNFLLYLVLAALGASSDFSSIRNAHLYLAAGVVWILLHGFFLFFIAGRFLKLPFPLLAISSQCNIGGIISGPILASVYHPSLVPVGLVLAILGNLYALTSAFLFAWMIA